MKIRSGMAHWAGTGPEGKRCVDCGHYDCPGDERGLSMQPTAACLKYRALTQRRGAKFGGWEAACRYFEAAA